MPIPPKPPELRQRRNRTSTRALLPPSTETAHNRVPPLPPREQSTEVWHPRVLEWWRCVWTSPMSAEYLGPDILGGLHMLAELYQQRWTAPGAMELVKLASEIRQQEVRFGLSPIDRRRLQWEVDKGERADDRTRRRRARKDVAGKDPRQILKVAK